MLNNQYKYIHFEKVADKTKPSVWHCCNNQSGDIIGEVRWYNSRRKYCYFSTFQAVYSVGCLDDIKDFIGQLERRRKSDDRKDSARKRDEILNIGTAVISFF